MCICDEVYIMQIFLFAVQAKQHCSEVFGREAWHSNVWYCIVLNISFETRIYILPYFEMNLHSICIFQHFTPQKKII